MPVFEIQKEPLVTENLASYEGGWVAIRDGKVIASALNSTELRDNPAVASTDTLMPAPHAGDATLYL
jgi:hypothetical protein